MPIERPISYAAAQAERRFLRSSARLKIAYGCPSLITNRRSRTGAASASTTRRSTLGRYAAAKAMEDTDLMELYMTDLFPEEEVDR
jgi:hypothetical protein